MFEILEGEDAEQALDEAEMILVDTVTNHENRASGGGGGNRAVDKTQVTIDADIVVVCEEGLSDMISGIKEMEE